MQKKPFSCKNYGSIGHLPNSRLGEGDHCVTDGQARIATVKTRDKHDRIIVQEKLDGSNVGVGRLNSQVIPMTRAGYRAETSPYEQHHLFAKWVHKNYDRFFGVLNEGERLVGEWLLQAHGTRYALKHEPFVAFDLMVAADRTPFGNFMERVGGVFVTPHVIECAEPITVEEALGRLGEFGYHGALDTAEGAVWRVERNNQVSHGSQERRWEVDFLTKFVRPDKQDGKYFPQITGGELVWNGAISDYAD
ncbi:MAG: RNA ligase family protein [Saprospiraceae bacterium]|nr:RNA ligase family protein [Saprospiraceae bacterium]